MVAGCTTHKHVIVTRRYMRNYQVLYNVTWTKDRAIDATLDMLRGKLWEVTDAFFRKMSKTQYESCISGDEAMDNELRERWVKHTKKNGTGS